MNLHPWAYLIGVDGGGSGTRVRLVDPHGQEIGQGHAGPSGLSRGIAAAWQAIETAIDAAFDAAGRARPQRAAMALGVGIAGANHEPWAAALAEQQPGFGALAIACDAWAGLLGAHAGAPGAVVAVGTGSVGAALARSGERRMVGGWGFPGGDEGSGAWIGLRAVGHLQRVLDGRLPLSRYATALLDSCGGHRGALLDWQAHADPARYASLAPLVLAHAPVHRAARAVLEEAGLHLEQLAQTLDPGNTLPLALCGGLAQPLMPYLPLALRARVRLPLEDAAQGALRLVAPRGPVPTPMPAAPAAVAGLAAPQGEAPDDRCASAAS